MSKIKEFELSSILQFGLTLEKVNSYDILCLPENLSRASVKEELFDASDAITLSKLLKTQGIICANSYDLNLHAQLLDRRSNDKWFGTVFIRNNIVFPMFVSVLSTLIANEITDYIKNGEKAVPKIHIELKLDKPNNITTLKYDGDPQTLITILKGIVNEQDTITKR